MVFHQDNTEQNYLGEFNHVIKYDPAVPHPMVVCAGDSLIEGYIVARKIEAPLCHFELINKGESET
jgi:hypothetical protein